MVQKTMNLKHLSTPANTVLNSCAERLGTTVDALLEEFNKAWKPELGEYSRKLVEYGCSKVLRGGPFHGTVESISDGSFSRLTFDMMLAWQMPNSADEESYMGERVCKENEDNKLPLKVTPAHEDVSLFYSDIMPLLVDHGPGVKEDAFVWFASVLPLPGDVANGRFTFETLTASTANLLHYPAYDRFLKEIDKCMKHLQRQDMPKGAKFADDEFILHVEGTASSQRVVRHIGGTSWPGRLTLTNYVLYFEASGSMTYEDALKIDLSGNLEQSVKSAATGPWGAPLFDKAMIYESLESAESVVLEFPEASSSTRRDHWLALTKEVILLHQFLSKHELKPTQVWEMHARTILGIVRLHAAREMLRMAPPPPRSFLIFTLFDELPKGDYVLEELAETLKLINTGEPCSASSILVNLNMPHDIEPIVKMEPQEGHERDHLSSTQDDSLSTLDSAVTEVREQAKEIESAKATTEGLKGEGVIDSAYVLMELLKPLRSSWSWFQQVLNWERPVATVNVLAAILLIAYLEWIGKALAVGLLWAAIGMEKARRRRIADKYTKVVVCTASDQTPMESIVSAQQGLRTAHDLVQQVNIAVLKFHSIILHRAPKQARIVKMVMVGMAAILIVVPFKYIVMASALYLFSTTSKVGKDLIADDKGNRRLKEWWDSIPVIPVETVDDPAERR